MTKTIEYEYELTAKVEDRVVYRRKTKTIDVVAMSLDEAARSVQKAIQEDLAELYQDKREEADECEA